MGRKPGIYLNLGNLMEPAGLITVCVGLGLLAGLAVALIAAGIILVVAAELVYDTTTVRAVPLPRSWPPRLRVRARVARSRRRAHARWVTRQARRAAARADRQLQRS